MEPKVTADSGNMFWVCGSLQLPLMEAVFIADIPNSAWKMVL